MRDVILGRTKKGIKMLLLAMFGIIIFVPLFVIGMMCIIVSIIMNEE